MSLPSVARPPSTAARDESKGLVCPRCERRWPTQGAPSLCPTDGIALLPASDLVDKALDPMVGRTLQGRYTILARLGAGSMGTVYRARQHPIGREVAIKILRGDRAEDESAKARFMREARANSLLASPNTVTVFDFGQSESGEFYLAMELLEGESLGQRIARLGRLPAPLAVDTARQALRSLSEAHAKGIIHRDLKPDNLFFARVLTNGGPPTSRRGGRDGREVRDVVPPRSSHEEIVKVLDFGIAKMLNPSDANAMGVVETQAGTVFGTPRYMSPEQAQGKPLDPRSDLYSLGVILYQMLTGRPPFTDNDAVVVMARHIKSIPKRPNEVCPEAQIPKELEDVIMRALAKEPDARPPSADAMASELLVALDEGAAASGIRPSVIHGTHGASGGGPESSRRPSMTPRRRQKRSTLAFALLPLVVLAAAGGVYLGMSRGTQPVPPVTGEAIPPTLMSAVSPVQTVAATAPGLNNTNTSTTTGANSDARALTPNDLPASPSATASPQGANAAKFPARPTPAGRPAAGEHGGARPSGGSPGPRASASPSSHATPPPASSRYDIFE